MHTLWIILRQEIKLMFRDTSFQVLTGVIALLTAYSVISARSEFSVAHQHHHELSDTLRHMFVHQKEKSAHMASHYGHVVFKPRTYLQAIDPGVIPFTGTTIRLEAHKQNEAAFAPASGQSSLVRFGAFSFSLLLQVIIPLLIFFTCYRSVILHRQDGTLKLLVSQGVSMRKLVAGKSLAYISIYWFYLVIAALFFSLLYVQHKDSANLNFLRTTAAISVYALYYALLIALTVYLSAATKNATALLSGLLALWFLFTIVVPKTTVNIGARMHPLPTRQMLTEEIREKRKQGVNGHDLDNIHTIRFKDSVLKAYNVTTPEELPVRLNGLVMQADEDFHNQLYDEALAGVSDRIAAQNKISSVAGFINPFIAVRNLSMAAAGTDMYHHFHFTREAELYRRYLVSKLNEQDILKQSVYKNSTGKLGKQFWSSTKEFSYQMPSLSWSLSHYRAEMISLGLWLLITFIVIFTSSNQIRIA